MSEEKFIPDDSITVKLPSSLKKRLEERVNENPELYGNSSHFVRVAIIRELNKNTEA